MTRCLLYLIVGIILSTAVVAAQASDSSARSCALTLRMQFEQWSDAYARRDLANTTAIFAKDVIFSFQGNPDKGLADLEASYRKSFAQLGASREWVPKFEEIYCSGDLGFVRSTWKHVVRDSTGKLQTVEQNRGIDIFRLERDSKWRIIRSVSYPLAR